MYLIKWPESDVILPDRKCYTPLTQNTWLTEKSVTVFNELMFFPFRHRLHQDDCACVLGHYIKDLSVLGRDLAKTVVLDNTPHTYPYHVSTVEL